MAVAVLCWVAMSAAELPQTFKEYESSLFASGLVKIRDLDSTIVVELKYAVPQNFMGLNVYGELRDCYLQAEAARKLVEANRILKSIRPDLSLLVADGFRPRHVQRRMWELVKDTPQRNYVANPAGGSMHNYGCAVDITICDKDHKRLDMGTPIDHFGPLSQVRLEQKHLREGLLTREQVENRRLLRQVMTRAGFRQLPIEWWHYDAFDKKVVRARFPIME